MKITGIEIGEYRQFKNINFDFTYPDYYHVVEKRGQPLEKVCFIGQSGTGKTTLLNVIEEYFTVIDDDITTYQHKIDRYEKGEQAHRDDSSYLMFDYIRRMKLSSLVDGKDVVYDRSNNDVKVERGSGIISWLIKEELIESLSKKKHYCFYIKDSIAREADAFLFDQEKQPQTFSDFVRTDFQIAEERAIREKRINKAGSERVVSLGDLRSLSTWQYLLKEVDEYDKLILQLAARLAAGEISYDEFKNQTSQWEHESAKPRVDLGKNCLNPILKKFFLEVDTTATQTPIALRTKQGIKIDSKHLSTGTRQILATAIPVYKFDTRDTVILFDEPERSLFPDIQRELVKYYTGLAPEAQFFFATHSPIIASAFEPCERFILYFDENGEVKCRNGVAPVGDDPNDILKADFGLNELMLDEGLEAYQEYRRLGMQIRSETDEQKKNELIAERLELGNRYNF